MKSLVTLVLISFFLSAAFQATEALRCHTCIDRVCSTMVCEPEYERCFTGTSTVDGQKIMMKGCATKALCDAFNPVETVETVAFNPVETVETVAFNPVETVAFNPVETGLNATKNFEKISCCDQDFCNSAEGVKLSLFIMLASLLSSILFI